MSRILLVAQEAGGVGKSTAARALAEAVPDAPIYEIEAMRRLVELGDRVEHFPIRAKPSDVRETGGEAALSEYDEVINGLISDKRPAIVDVGANGAEAVLTSFGRMRSTFARRGRQVGVVIVVAADESAYASAEKLLALSKPWASAQFVVANEHRGAIDRTRIDGFAQGAVVTQLASFNIPKAVRPLVEPLGFALIGQLDEEKLAGQLADRKGNANYMLAANVTDIVAGFRLGAMTAVRPAAEWMIA
jgi:hypothetical protein